MTLGDVVNQYRRQSKISMREFARRSGLSVSYVSVLEKNVTQRGDIPVPSLDTFKACADTMHMTVDKLMRMIDGDTEVHIGTDSASQLIQLLTELSPAEEEKVVAFVQGLIAGR